MTRLDEKLLRSLESRVGLIGRTILYVEQTPSTNDLGHERARESGSKGLVIVADHQSAGRGQQGREWFARPGDALLFSVVLAPEGELSSPAFLTAWAASAVADSIRSLGLPATIKWPNDVRIGGRKVCGILTERREAIVVGVGLNVSIPREAFPLGLRQPPTSLALELARPVDRTELFVDIVKRLDDTYLAARADGPSAVWEHWPTLSEHRPGQKVAATTAGGERKGVLISVRPDSGLDLRTESGLMHLAPEQLLRIEPLPTQEP